MQRDAAAVSTAAAAARSFSPSDGVLAPLTGNVWKIEVEAGQRVQEGDLLLILEAMKMENEICAHKDGIVTELMIEQGCAVEIGQPLMLLQ